MIITRVTDGLGNQMFQYALGRYLSIKNDTDLLLDLCWYKNRSSHGGTNRRFTLKNFNIKAREATKRDIEEVVPFGALGRKVIHTPILLNSLVEGRSPSIPAIGRLLSPGISRKRLAESYNYVWEYSKAPDSTSPQWAYRRRFYAPVLDLDDGVYLHGYWQSPKYFEKIKERLREEFKPKSIRKNVQKVKEKIKASNSVAVHVRRGDFIEQGPGRGNLLPKKYYKKARKIVENCEENLRYFVFSDNPEWASKNRFMMKKSTHVTNEYGTEEHEDIYLMSLCNHNICANSTFSWWSSWVNNNEDSVIIYPSPWKKYGYPNGIIHEWGLFPEGWKVVTY
ncbi:alpha-1,2-fucosyltransferase [Salinibacter sp.]|uniref:alpha-1,2-fucosyltransferase n=1 Tax=Salinibacter sp. TaxID=2065818 RepID=UPI0021E88AF6|nr:alpha-1,2-fucosyltransferase [Salinibacter sp.]